MITGPKVEKAESQRRYGNEGKEKSFNESKTRQLGDAGVTSTEKRDASFATRDEKHTGMVAAKLGGGVAAWKR